MSVELIPSGKHRGKELTELSNSQLMSMQGSWIDSQKLRSSPFIEKIHSEVAGRGLRVARSKPVANVGSAGRGEKLVDAKCYTCEKAYRISSNSWNVSGGSRKPTCDCSGPVYLANPESVVTYIGQNF